MINTLPKPPANPPADPTPRVEPENARLDLDTLKKDLAGILQDYFNMFGDVSKEFTEKTLLRTEAFLAEHSTSPNFTELSKHFAATTLNDAAVYGLQISSETQIRMRVLVVTLLSTLRVALVPA